MFRVLLILTLAAACAPQRTHERLEPARMDDQLYEAGDQVIPIRTVDQVTGRYRFIDSGDGFQSEMLRIELKDGGLVLRKGEAEEYRCQIRPDGALAIRGHYGAHLVKRRGRTLLRVSWAYAYGIYERLP